MFGTREVRFARIRLEPERSFDGFLGQSESRGSMINAEEIELVVCESQLALRNQERGIALQGLVEQINRLSKLRSIGSAEAYRNDKIPRATVEIEGGDISRGRLLNSFLLTRRKFGLQLISDCFGDFALDGEHVIDWPVVILRPLMRVGARINQLRVHPHLVTRPLHTALQQMCDSKLLADLAGVSRRARLVLHHTRAADHLEVGHFG